MACPEGVLKWVYTANTEQLYRTHTGTTLPGSASTVLGTNMKYIRFPTFPERVVYEKSCCFFASPGWGGWRVDVSDRMRQKKMVQPGSESRPNPVGVFFIHSQDTKGVCCAQYAALA